MAATTANSFVTDIQPSDGGIRDPSTTTQFTRCQWQLRFRHGSVPVP